jgi:uncharacterized protein YacL
MEAIATVSGHMWGFSGILFFQVLMHDFNHTLQSASFVVLGAAAIFLIYVLLVARLRECWRHGEHHWSEACEEVEDDAIMLCMSLLVSALFLSPSPVSCLP